MAEQLSRAHLRSRYVFIGTLVLDTALHIGGGRDQPGASDSPVVRNPLGRPFIPGSSFKGAFRAAVERLAPNLGHVGVRSCGLQLGYQDCITTHRVSSIDNEGNSLTQASASVEEKAQKLKLDEAYRVISAQMGRRLDSANTDTQAALIRLERSDLLESVVTGDSLIEVLDRWLCDTCKVFGAPYLTAAAQFVDLPVQEPWHDLIQVRDGVGIDRDSERARERIKYDFEAVPPGTEFHFRLTVDNPSRRDLGLVAIGLQEFVNGMVSLGGIRSRGLGRCHLDNLQVSVVNFANVSELIDYLTNPTPAYHDAGPLLSSAITRLLNPQKV